MRPFPGIRNLFKSGIVFGIPALVRDQAVNAGVFRIAVVPGNLAVRHQAVYIGPVEHDPAGQDDRGQQGTDPPLRPDGFDNDSKQGQQDDSDAPHGDHPQGGETEGFDIQVHPEICGDVNNDRQHRRQRAEDPDACVFAEQGQGGQDQAQGQQGYQHQLEKAAAGVGRVAAAHPDAFCSGKKVTDLHIAEERVHQRKGSQHHIKHGGITGTGCDRADCPGSLQQAETVGKQEECQDKGQDQPEDKQEIHIPYFFRGAVQHAGEHLVRGAEENGGQRCRAQRGQDAGQEVAVMLRPPGDGGKGDAPAAEQALQVPPEAFP